jgi:hypothetical protein
MSIKHRILLTIGLLVVGSFGWAAARDLVDADEPREPGASADNVAALAREGYLLLTSGQLIQGIVSEEGSEYVVVQRVGTMKFPRKRVEGAFDSVRAAYEYKLAQLPDRDPDERMKLALWCLNLKLTAEAKGQLTEILKRNPSDKHARSMLISMEQAATRAALRQRDPQVRQTGAAEMSEQKPATLDSAILHRARRGMQISDLPVILDLPAPLAIKRAEEFARYVHPVLQFYCAKCHDEQYEGAFQLVRIKGRSDRTPEALRANLDATLRLVDQKNPSHSDLLTSSLRSHGRGPRPRPIFPGSNDPTYRILAAWVKNLGPPKTQELEPQARVASRALAGEPFAVGRDSANPDRPGPEAAPMPTDGARAGLASEFPPQTKIPPPAPFGSGRGAVRMDQNPADPDEFPLPFAITGVKPNLRSPVAEPAPRARSSSPRAASGATAQGPVAAGTASAPARGSTKPDSAADRNKSAEAAKGKEAADTSKKPAKPLVLDPKLLERALQNRNANRTGQ